MKNSKVLIAIVVTALVVGAGGFFGGMKYQQGKQPSGANFQAWRGDRQGAPRMQRPEGSQALRGEILNQDENSLTVKLPDGSSKIVLLSESTTINKATTATKDDLKTGEQVMIFGSTNADGSISASQIQLNSGFGGGGPQGPQGNE